MSPGVLRQESIGAVLGVRPTPSGRRRLPRDAGWRRPAPVRNLQARDTVRSGEFGCGEQVFTTDGFVEDGLSPAQSTRTGTG